MPAARQLGMKIYHRRTEVGTWLHTRNNKAELTKIEVTFSGSLSSAMINLQLFAC